MSNSKNSASANLSNESPRIYRPTVISNGASRPARSRESVGLRREKSLCGFGDFHESASMKAMILAAGLGTRLRPLTDSRPKALVEINGRTLLEITLARLHTFGINEVIINVHHFADMVVAYLKSKSNFGMRIEISREDDLLLDTGGCLKKASWFFLEEARRSPLATRHSPTEPFLLHNVDVISTI